jgi:phosphatidylserine/phosphatidylglycerophosphate/cardiolipin synthase-like enzyme
MRPGATVWRAERAERAALLVDMQAYFKAAKSAMSQARRSIHLLGWSFDPDARFAPDEDGAGPSRDRIGAFLKHLACNRPEVDVRLLVWKSALPVAASQNFFPHRARRAFRHTPVRFRLDGALPLGACHHQKAIIIDDRVAFCGGGDIAPDRWDTPLHLDDDPHRTSHRRGKRFFDARHEVMTVFDGAPAQALGDLFRERWKRGTGQVLAPPVLTQEEVHGEAGDPWPEGVEPDFRHAMVGFARSRPAWRSHPESREAERLHLAAIGAAEHCIYMENQYLASPLIAEALAARLAQPDGPEVVLVSTQHSPSWFDQMTMDRTRLAFLKRLKEADEAGRPGGGKLHAYCPLTKAGRTIIVHAKVTIIDDVLLRVGSANINNRSTGFDTECDVGIEVDGGPAGAEARATIRRLRTGLLAHWLGRPEAAVDAAIAAAGGVGAAVEALDDPARRRLSPLEPAPIGPLATLIAAYHLGDPAGPDDSWRPWKRRAQLELKLKEAAERLEDTGLPAPCDDLSPETI